MSLHLRNVDPAVLGPIAAEINNLRKQVATSGSKFHADVTSKAATTGDYSSPVAGVAATCATADASDTDTGVALANDLKALLLAHGADALAHKAVETSRATTLAAVAAASDDATMQTLAAAIQVFWNGHNDDAVKHFNADNADDATSISSAATARTSLNAIKAAYNTHVASAPTGSSIVLDAP